MITYKPSAPPPPDLPLLTVATVRALRSDYEADVKLLAELPARIEAKKRRLDAAMLFVPPGTSLDGPELAMPVPQPVAKQVLELSLAPSDSEESTAGDEDRDDDDDEIGESAKRITWSSAMAEALAAADKGVTHKELLEKLVETPLGSRRSNGDKGFYKAIARLKKVGAITQAGGLIYHKDVAARIIEKLGELPDAHAETNRREGGTASMVVRVLRQHPEGLVGPELKELVGAMPGAPKSLTGHSQYIYNVLAKLIGSGAVAKDGGLYRLAETLS